MNIPRTKIIVSVGLVLLLCTFCSAFASSTSYYYFKQLPPYSSCTSKLKSHEPSRKNVRLSGQLSLSAQQETIAADSKTREEVNFITTALLKNSLFSDISETSLKELVNGFQLNEANQGDDLVTQGDSCEGDYVYLTYEGECEVVIDGNTIPDPYGTIQPATVFGELSFLYDMSRAATVRVRSDVLQYYRVDGRLFHDIMSKPKEDLKSMQAIDAAINQVSGTDSLYGGDVIQKYKPERVWLWQQFRGTVIKISLVPTLINMLLCATFVVYARYNSGDPLFEVGAGAPTSTEFVEKLNLVGQVWEMDKTLTTFVLTFFVNQSYSFWKDVYQLARDVQGKINDFNLLNATNVKRTDDGSLSPESEQLLAELSCYR